MNNQDEKPLNFHSHVIHSVLHVIIVIYACILSKPRGYHSLPLLPVDGVQYRERALYICAIDTESPKMSKKALESAGPVWRMQLPDTLPPKNYKRHFKPPNYGVQSTKEHNEDKFLGT